MGLTPYTKGVAIATAGVLAATPDGVLIRWATRLGAPPAQVIFWKVLFNGIWAGMMLIGRERANGRGIDDLVGCWRAGWLYLVPATALQAVIVILFPTAFLLTLAANVMLCVSMAPLIAAILGSVFLKEAVPTRTKAAIAGALVAIAIMFIPKLLGASPEPGGVGGSLGDAAALVVSVVTACYLVLARAAGLAAIPVEIASGAGALLAALVVGVAICANGDSLFHNTSPLFFLAMVINGFGLACIYLSFSIAPKYISGAQVGLISLLETVIGPLWCFAIYSETPPPATLVGGAILIVAVASHEVLAMREENTALAQKAPSERDDLRIASARKATYAPVEVTDTAPR